MGRPIVRLVPWPTISTSVPAAVAAARTSASALSSAIRIGSATFLEPRQVGEACLPVVDMDAPELRAAAQLREHFPWIEQPVRIEGAFEAQLLIEVGLAEHHRHQVALFDADTVLAGEHAADFDAKLEDLRAERLGARELAELVGVIEDQRM